MPSLCTSVIFVSYILKLACSERRIVNGTKSVGDPRYLAYFVKSPLSDQKYTGWVCGGSIVHPSYILTSAACLEDVKHVYAIIGYSKYIKSEDIEKDDCTRRIKKKVISRSFQKDYDLKQYQAFYWNSRDIGLAKVESPYDFRNPVYTTYCSYAPAMIRVNFNGNFEDPGTETVTFGWGHKKYFRAVGDLADYNEEHVHYASTVVIDKELCKDKLIGHTDIKIHVNLYLICTLGPGSLDETGKFINAQFNGSQGCSNNVSQASSQRYFRKNNENTDFDVYSTFDSRVDLRRNGPCQNDHGGPLVTWIGGREYVIGVACGFQVNKLMECVGPYLYTSTYSNGDFIYCMLRNTRRSRCNASSREKGFEIVEEEIKWDGKTVTREREKHPALQEDPLAEFEGILRRQNAQTVQKTSQKNV